ncbi:MAG TPA: nicotinate (nicotinamide) nucleotide adenylyltransferase [Thermodesulfobium narugense]|uniref:Probable nicotinate-nucleotide adenylyltransferase n=1 Tax=Thermodesulfobium acidiphilum TaxID=1794699 RepID=A0A2R4W1Q6_THEAF|nr:nicotinate (nicotinamide) nucleotide adenylyltransferase [Thermodesulfobium acidiphilum]AWB10674.1 nicotinate-nucleotide adenylyltransferase [Thermodesulfobium acidiphilum]PMP85264.1 MAG: nicotinate (nicotinamide) nucleotide adenylyltransferase [Thermodesulfobium narugense]HEM55948.1 nicotinate (nicotinamide) nucleotide adenylyltransferase [Thermodesulfobium narugense]
MVKLEHRIAILGGTFDPVHIGHLKLGQSALNIIDPDTLFWIPAKRSPLKNRIYASDFHRWCMLYECIKNEKRYTLSDLELIRKEPSYTYLTLVEIKKRYPGSQLYFIMGLDTALSLTNWYKIDDILKICKFVVFKRNVDKDNSIEKLPEEIFHNIDFFEVDIPDISSNLIRKKVALNENLSEFLDPSTIEYIKRFNLYK